MNYYLAERIEKIKAMSIEELCKCFNCNSDEICMGDYIARNTKDKECPYKVVLGYADFGNSKITQLGKLEIVFGKRLQDDYGPLTDINKQPVFLGLNLKDSDVYSLGNLKKVYGSCSLNEHITSLDNLEYIGSNLYLNNTYVSNLGNLQEINGRLNLESMKGKLKSLGNLKKVHSIYIDIDTLQDVGKLEKVKKIIYGKNCGSNVIRLINAQLGNEENIKDANI